MNVLIIAPHPDDESIGCGGAARWHVLRHDRVAVIYLTSGELGLKEMKPEQAWAVREGEARRAARILGLKEPVFLRRPDWTLGEHVEAAAEGLRPVLKSEAPELVYLPHPGEWHPDHKAASPIFWSALDQGGAFPLVRGYEIWTPLSEYDYVENIDETMATKLRAIRAHRSQLEQMPYDRAIRALNEYRGVLAGRCRFAEVFQTLKHPDRGGSAGSS